MDNDSNAAPSPTTVTPVAEPRQETVEPSIASSPWPVWTTSSRLGAPGSPARRRWARRFGRLLAADADELARRAREEISKPEWETVAAELLPTVAACRWHERRAGRILRPRKVRDRPWWLLGQAAKVVRVPFGRVGIIATWNYPIQLLGIQLVQAVVAGNRVVVKPSERTPRTQSRLLELAAHAGLDEHELEVRPADRQAGAAMLEEPDLDHVVFTGSTQVGRHVAIACAERLIPTTLELSGCDTVVVLDDADPAQAAKVAWHALLMNHGQTCMAPRRVLVHESLASRFAAALVPLAAGAAPRRLADRSAADRHRTLVRDGVQRGARLASLVPDERTDEVVRPQVLLDCPVEADAFSADHFGPLFAASVWTDREELLRMHRCGGKHLATSVFTSDPGRAEALAPSLGGGLVTTNDTIIPFAHPAVSLAPAGDSGWGVSQGIEGLLAMTRPMTITRTARLRVPPGEPDDRAKSFLRGLVDREGRGTTPPPSES